MTENNEKWTLFQIYDEVSERWSPIYCGPSLTAVRLDIDELSKKQPNRPMTVVILGTMVDGDFKPERQEIKIEVQE